MNFCRVVVLLFVTFVSSASVDAVTIPTVPIGNPGNPADLRYLHEYHPAGVGSVGYSFSIGKTEITNSQYVAFLNAVADSDPYELYSSGMDSFGIARNGISGSYAYDVKPPLLNGSYTWGDKPVVYVSSGDAMRFANWMHNGQPTGPQNGSTTEDGAYTLNGAVTDVALIAVTRNPGASWWLPNEDEWYKAAYHKNDGVTGNYWDYPTGTNSVPNNHPPSTDTGNSANFYSNGYATMGGLPLTDAGAYTQSDSPYGTFDQGGNVFEWNETPFTEFPYRGNRGGAYFSNFTSVSLSASAWSVNQPSGDAAWLGFRVATIIPEPATIWLELWAVAGVFCRTRRRL